MMSKKQKLKPCPFCGGHAKRLPANFYDSDTCPFIECRKCHANVSGEAAWEARVVAKTSAHKEAPVARRQIAASVLEGAPVSPFKIIEKHRNRPVIDTVKRIFEDAGIVYTTASYASFRTGKMRVTRAMADAIAQHVGFKAVFWWELDGVYAAEDIAADRALFRYFDSLHPNHEFWHNKRQFTKPVFLNQSRNFRDGRHSTLSEVEPSIKRLMNKHYARRPTTSG
jgi:hypothetical protein